MQQGAHLPQIHDTTSSNAAAATSANFEEGAKLPGIHSSPERNAGGRSRTSSKSSAHDKRTSSKSSSHVRRTPLKSNSSTKSHKQGAAISAESRQRRWAALFGSLDTSGDSLIDKKEFLAAAASWTASCPTLDSAEVLDFADWDSDGNGVLCEGEFFCLCDALWKLIGEREFQALEAKAAEDAKAKIVAGQGGLPSCFS